MGYRTIVWEEMVILPPYWYSILSFYKLLIIFPISNFPGRELELFIISYYNYFKNNF